MGITRNDLFDGQTNELAELAKVLGHPARIRILQILLDTDSCITGDLVDDLGLAQPTVSQHLKALKESGLIRGDIDGTKVCYCIDTDRWKVLQKVLGDFIFSPSIDKKCC
jgi:ArsR family transcriptional regulator